MGLGRFKTKEVTETITVGECLKRKREELGISLKEVSKRLKIKQEYLENIEKSDYDKLPPSVYVKGFIKNYARLAGLDSERMINLYKKETVFEDKIKKREKDFKNKQGLEKKFVSMNYPLITPKFLTAVLGLIAILIIGYYLWHQISSFSSIPYLFVASPFSGEVTGNSEIIVKGETEKDVNLKINGEEVLVDPNGFFQENIMLQPGKNTLIIEATNKFNKTAEEDIDIIYEKELEKSPFDFEKEQEKDSMETGEGTANFDEEKIEMIGP